MGDIRFILDLYPISPLNNFLRKEGRKRKRGEEGRGRGRTGGRGGKEKGEEEKEKIERKIKEGRKEGKNISAAYDFKITESFLLHWAPLPQSRFGSKDSTPLGETLGHAGRGVGKGRTNNGCSIRQATTEQPGLSTSGDLWEAAESPFVGVTTPY